MSAQIFGNSWMLLVHREMTGPSFPAGPDAVSSMPVFCDEYKALLLKEARNFLCLRTMFRRCIMGNRGKAPCFLNLSTRSRWIVISFLRSLYPRHDYVGGYMGLRSNLCKGPKLPSVFKIKRLPNYSLYELYYGVVSGYFMKCRKAGW
jgi:hypothetical protein